MCLNGLSSANVLSTSFLAILDGPEVVLVGPAAAIGEFYAALCVNVEIKSWKTGTTNSDLHWLKAWI
jgi:hypothetical protein